MMSPLLLSRGNRYEKRWIVVNIFSVVFKRIFSRVSDLIFHNNIIFYHRFSHYRDTIKQLVFLIAKNFFLPFSFLHLTCKNEKIRFTIRPFRVSTVRLPTKLFSPTHWYKAATSHPPADDCCKALWVAKCDCKSQPEHKIWMYLTFTQDLHCFSALRCSSNICSVCVCLCQHSVLLVCGSHMTLLIQCHLWIMNGFKRDKYIIYTVVGQLRPLVNKSQPSEFHL